MKILNQLLWSGKNRWQIIGAAIGAFIGLFLLLSALQLYFDLQRLVKGDSSTEQFVLINKKVNLFNTLGARSTFTEEEISDLKIQEFHRVRWYFCIQSIQSQCFQPDARFLYRIVF